jgi:hypothetical protein
MTRKITALTSANSTWSNQGRAIDNSDRFLVESNDEPAVLILSVADYAKTFAPPPDWLEKSWGSAKRRGLHQLTFVRDRGGPARTASAPKKN